MTDDNQGPAMAALNEALATGFETADFEALRPFYAEDAVLLPPRSRPLKGRQAIVAFWTGVRNRFAGMAFATGESKMLGDSVARETGTYEMAAGEGGGTQTTGKYLVVWQKIDGGWQVESCIWSRNADAQAGRGGQGGNAGGGQGRGQQGRGGGYRQPGQAAGGQTLAGQGYRQQGGGQAGYGAGGGRNRGGIASGAGVGGGGAGIGGAGRRGNPQGGQRGQGGPGQGRRGQSLYDDNPGLYSNRDD